MPLGVRRTPRLVSGPLLEQVAQAALARLHSTCCSNRERKYIFIKVARQILKAIEKGSVDKMVWPV